MTIQTVLNVTQTALVIDTAGHLLGSREPYLYDDATISPANFAILQAHLNGGRLRLLTGGVTIPSPSQGASFVSVAIQGSNLVFTDSLGGTSTVAIPGGDVDLSAYVRADDLEAVPDLVLQSDLTAAIAPVTTALGTKVNSSTYTAGIGAVTSTAQSAADAAAAATAAAAAKLGPADVAKVATTGVDTDLTRRPLTFNQRLGYPVVTRRPDLVVGTKTQIGLNSIYVPWIVRVPDAVRAAYPAGGKWRVYTSTDHDNGDGGIAIGVTNLDNPLDMTGWTWLRNNGSAKMFFDGVGAQTETPCVVWNPDTQLFHLYYQVASGTTQYTKVATSPNGVDTWTVVGAALPNPSNAIAGWNHRGYAKVYYVDGIWAAWHLQGSGTAVSAYGWSFSMDGLTWVTDRRRTGAALQMTDGTLRFGVSSLFHWRGDIWALMSETDYVSGATAAGTIRAGVAPINAYDDFRSFRGRPQMYSTWSTLIGVETGVTTPPPSFAPLDDGRLVGAYRLNGENGSLALAVLA